MVGYLQTENEIDNILILKRIKSYMDIYCTILFNRDIKFGDEAFLEEITEEIADDGTANGISGIIDED